LGRIRDLAEEFEIIFKFKKLDYLSFSETAIFIRKIFKTAKHCIDVLGNYYLNLKNFEVRI